jgi:hypothetical protein
MVLAAEALGVDLVDLLGPRGTGGEPAVLRHHLEAADGGAIAGGVGELGEDRFADELGGGHLLGGQGLEDLLLLAAGGGVDAAVGFPVSRRTKYILRY